MEANPLWYKDAILYELHPRAFRDSNGDGIGDFRGLISKLDYVQDLGVTAIWLLPFYPSPLRDDGYDIADYTSVHPNYGSLSDVRLLVREAHRRNLRVITELVCNHTSDQHAWFQAARRAKPGSPARDFYVWSDTPDKYREARVIFKDFEASNWTWDPLAHAYFWHRFYSHQPDLNYDNPRVRQAIFKVMDFWLQMGVDGLRLDAVPYLFEREGTNGENLPETHAFLKELRAHVDSRFQDRVLLAEANQWPEDSVAYFGEGDECHMAFHFPVMPRLFMSIQMEDRFPILDILAQTPPIPPTAQWALFLRNHDELTLEMVTDEERDYMYRVYARDAQARINLGIRRRLAPLLANNRRRIELMNGLLFSLPGTPVLYYGDEIGMGDNIYLGDRNSVRTPMQWNADRNAGFSDASSQRLYLPVITETEYHYVAVNVEAQQNNHQSLLWWTKRLIALRKDHPAFGRGSLEFLQPDNRKVLVFVRQDEHETLLVVANLSRFSQYAELDLGRWCGSAPVELFGRTEFPVVGDGPYTITVGPHGFYWFALEAQIAPVSPEVPRLMPELAGEQGGPETAAMRTATLGSTRTWDELIGPDAPSVLSRSLASYLQTHAWLVDRKRRIKAVEISDAIPLPPTLNARLAILEVRYEVGEPEVYLMPLAFAADVEAQTVLQDQAQSVVCELQTEGRRSQGVLYEATIEPAFWQSMLSAVRGRHRYKGTKGEMRASTMPVLQRITRAEPSPIPFVSRESGLSGPDRQRAAVGVYGDRLALRLFRRLETGISPGLEVEGYLTQRGFPNVPALAGSLSYRRGDDTMVLGALSSYTPSQGNAWQYTVDALSHYLERMAAQSGSEAAPRQAPRFSVSTLLSLGQGEPPPIAHELLGPFAESARVLGERSAELHLALAAEAGNPSLAPEPFTTLYQRSVYQSLRSDAGRAFQILRRSLQRARSPVSESLMDQATEVLGYEEAALQRFRGLLRHKIEATRIRCHGDYDLAHVLYTGKDFVITDLEDDQSEPPGERRIKRSPLRDVAGMLWSFHSAGYAALLGLVPNASVRPEDFDRLEPWTEFWVAWAGATFLQAYLQTARGASFVPAETGDTAVLLDAFLLQRALTEMGSDLENRPAWLAISLRGLAELLDGAA